MEEVSLAEMVAPVPGETAVGADVRSAGAGSDLYLSIKDERATARAAEREALGSGDPDVDPLAAGIRSWTIVSAQGGELLANHSKDLQVAAWIVEAWIRTDGLPGLADGFTLLAELVDNYWQEGLHPAEDEDGPEARLAPLFGLFGRDEPGTLIQPIKLLPLSDRGDARVALWSIEAIRNQSIRHDDPEVREELATRHAQRVAQLDAAVASATPDFAARTLDAINRALEELERLMTALEKVTAYGRFGSQVTNPLNEIADILRTHHVVAASDSDTPRAASIDSAKTSDAPPGNEPPAKQISLDRGHALATLIEIAGFFDKTEPQSLIGPSLRDLVRRAHLPLDDLLAELLPDRDQRAMFFLRAGVRKDSGGGDGFNSF